uniref:Uncharacterized protein n=1 Tax=Steinernema glaseri TaxID=37863 RepID=A0A1I7Y3R4_9BILA
MLEGGQRDVSEPGLYETRDSASRDSGLLCKNPGRDCEYRRKPILVEYNGRVPHYCGQWSCCGIPTIYSLERSLWVLALQEEYHKGAEKEEHDRAGNRRSNIVGMCC